MTLDNVINSMKDYANRVAVAIALCGVIALGGCATSAAPKKEAKAKKPTIEEICRSHQFSIRELKTNPNKYSGRLVRVEGVLVGQVNPYENDYLWFDLKGIGKEKPSVEEPYFITCIIRDTGAKKSATQSVLIDAERENARGMAYTITVDSVLFENRDVGNHYFLSVYRIKEIGEKGRFLVVGKKPDRYALWENTKNGAK